MSKTVLLITHEETDASDYGYVASHLTTLGHEVIHHTVLEATKGKDGFKEANIDFPSLDGLDSVIMFGSFTHAYAEQTRDWVEQEIAYVAQIRDRGMPYLGICFGAQILAEVLGGKTVKSDRLEVGMIQFSADPSCPVAAGPWFSWHNDKVELPADVEVLASSDLAPQVFQAGNSLGVQFHPEVTDELMDEWLRVGSGELVGKLNPEEFRRQWRESGQTAQRHGRELLERFMNVEPVTF
ncbi:MAG: gamma-glutamyl-gamma-aminobutyrate hydrolase family protein [Actinomycetales bacterium]|nr:gamma-glutamyl-gamma-aminobutyrate hydrolase family protein [Actinomycetales bacterium]